MPKRLLTILYSGFAEWEVIFPLFCVHPAIEAHYVSLDGRRVRGAMGFEMETGRAVADVDPGGFAGVYLPGGLDPKTKRFPRELGTHRGLIDLLREFARQEKVVAAICGAPLVLGAAGLLDGRRFACTFAEDTRGWFDRARRAKGTWAVDGRILTASLRGLVRFSAALARLLGEEETAREIGEYLDLTLKKEGGVKIDVPLSIPEGREFPDYREKEQLGRWIWRHIQIPQLLFLVTTLKENGIPNCEVNNWGLPFGFVPNQMFAFYCGRFHHTGRNILRDGEFVVNVPGADIGETAVRTARSYGDGVDEIAESGLTAIPSAVVAPPRIEECRAHLECALEWYKEVDESGAILFCGRVLAASGDRDVLTGDIESKMEKMRPIYVMPRNIDTEKMILTAPSGAYADIGRIRYTAQG